MKAPRQSAVGHSPLPVRSAEQLKAAFRTAEPKAADGAALGRSEHSGAALRNSEQDAARILDAAFTAAGISTKEIAHLCGVSGSLVEKWRSTESRGSPSFVQLLLLPPSFHVALHRHLNRHYGLGRAALGQLLEAAGALTVLVEP